MAERRMAIIRCLLCLSLSVCLLTGYGPAADAWAAETVSPQNPCTINLTYVHDGPAVYGVPVTLYHIADVSASYRYTLTQAFSASELTLNGITSAGEWNVIRSTLQSYILSQGIRADYAGSTSQTGQICFENLTPGLYLAQAQRTTQDGLIYTFEAAMIAVPGVAEDGSALYEVTAVPKSQVTWPYGPEDPNPDKEVEYKILKLWKGDEPNSDRPESIEVELFCDGELYETVVLSEANQWFYTWTAKESTSWTAAERNIPAGYTATLGMRENTFVLTNTWVPDNPPPEDPSDETPEIPDGTTDVPSGDTPGDITDTTDEESPGDNTETSGPKTGDTSSVLLYVILMYVSGSILSLLGIAGKRKIHEE